MNSTPLKSLSGVSSPNLLEQARTIVDSIEPSWQKGKAYPLPGQKVVTQTYDVNDLNGDYWAARLTKWDNTVPEDTKKTLHANLVKYISGSLDSLQLTHTHYEKEYVYEIYDFKLTPYKLDDFDAENYSSITYLAEVRYRFSFPLKKRVFFALVHVLKAHDDSEIFVIQQSIDPSLVDTDYKNDSSVLRGMYTSLERVLYKDGVLNWTATTCQDPGGAIPEWITKLAVKGALSKDVPRFIDWTSNLKPST